MFRSLPNPRVMEVRSIGPTRKALTEISGMQLVMETLISQ